MYNVCVFLCRRRFIVSPKATSLQIKHFLKGIWSFLHFLLFVVHDFKRKSKVKDGLPLILFPCVTANICNYLRYYHHHHYNRLMASNFKLQHDHNNI